MLPFCHRKRDTIKYPDGRLTRNPVLLHQVLDFQYVHGNQNITQNAALFASAFLMSSLPLANETGTLSKFRV